MVPNRISDPRKLCKTNNSRGGHTEKLWKVYVHINKSNGKRYVGITSKVKVEHRWNEGRGYSRNPRFFSAIKKYGWDNFEHIVLHDGLTEEAAKAMERQLIAKWATNNLTHGYNLTSGGDGTSGYSPSDETRRKLSNARRKENLSAETLARRSASLTGRKLSNEHKHKIGVSNSKAVLMFDKNGNFIQTFSSAHEAEVVLGINHSHISQCCNNKRHSTGGYVWKFAQ